MTGFLILACILAVGALYVLLRKDAGDAREGQAAKEALKDVTDANRPATADELNRVRDKYSRD